MRTKEQIDQFKKILWGKISSTSPRAHRAVAAYCVDGRELEEVLDWAEREEATARERWLESAVDPWAHRHGITREQALSICFDDSAFNPKTRKDDRPTQDAIFAWGGQQNDFASYLLTQANQRTEIEVAQPQREN